MANGFPLQDTGPGMSELFHDLAVDREERAAADADRRERAATILDRRYPEIAAKIRAGMRSSTWKEDLVDPGLLIDLLEAEAGKLR